MQAYSLPDILRLHLHSAPGIRTYSFPLTTQWWGTPRVKAFWWRTRESQDLGYGNDLLETFFTSVLASFWNIHLTGALLISLKTEIWFWLLITKWFPIIPGIRKKAPACLPAIYVLAFTHQPGGPLWPMIFHPSSSLCVAHSRVSLPPPG